MADPADTNRSFEWHVELRQVLFRYFNEDELASLCFDLGIDYDDLAGESKSKRIVELIEHFARSGRIPELIDKGRQVRPNIAWDKLASAALQNPLVFEHFELEADLSKRKDRPGFSLSQIEAMLRNRRALAALLIAVGIIGVAIIGVIGLTKDDTDAPGRMVEAYWEMVGDGKYEIAWDMLTTRFRRDWHESSLANYQQGFQGLCSVDAKVVSVQDYEDTARVTTHLKTRRGDGCTQRGELTIDLYLKYDEIRQLWLIDESKSSE